VVKDMSDPVTNVEIEDVLSSIRKLVSADDRSSKEADTSDEARIDKLVLTPSLRVDTTSVSPDETVAPGESTDEREGNASSECAEMSDDAEAPVAESPDDPSDDTTEVLSDDPVQSDTPGEHDVMDDAWEDDEPVHAAEDLLPEPGSEEEDDQGADADQVALTSSRAAVFEKAAAAQDDDAWEQEEATDEAPPEMSEATVAWEDSDVIATHDDMPSDVHAASEDEGLEPFTPEEDDVAEAEIYADDAETPTGNAFHGDADVLGDDEAVLDEEALRDLVAEIVRQELQGALGERITRNVRKLVRREIQRALAAQELE